MEEKELKLFIGEYYNLKSNKQIIKSIDTEFFFGLVDGLLKSLEEKDKEIEQLKQENKLTASQIYQIQQEAYYKGYADRDKIAINICKNGCKKDYEIELLKKQIDLMSEEILKLDIEKSKFEYDHARIYDTSEFIKQYFKNKVNELEKEELLKTIF